MKKKTIHLIPRLVKVWVKLTPEMRRRLTRLMHSTPGTMRQYVEGRREISPELAIRLEKATDTLGVEPLNRMQLNKTCNQCEYARLACGRKLNLEEAARIADLRGEHGGSAVEVRAVTKESGKGR